MRKIREVLRLHAAGYSGRQIAVAIGSALSSVQECLRRAREAGLTWPLPEALTEDALHAQLYRCDGAPEGRRPAPDFSHVRTELMRPGVTRMLLWQEYKAAHPDGWQYSVFCDRYQRWLATQALALRQTHEPGDKCFVDYAGQTLPVTDRHTGELRQAQTFVAVLGCSNYTYAEATFSQQLPDWLGAHVRALAFFGGVPRAFVPDNLRGAVAQAHRYEPALNRSYQDFAEHYDLAILPARVCMTPKSIMGMSAISPALGSLSPTQECRPPKKPRAFVGISLPPSWSTRPQANRPSLRDTDQNCPGRSCAVDFGANG